MDYISVRETHGKKEPFFYLLLVNPFEKIFSVVLVRGVPPMAEYVRQ